MPRLSQFFKTSILLASLSVTAEALADDSPVRRSPSSSAAEDAFQSTAEVRATCKRIGAKLGSVSYDECLEAELTMSGAYSVTGVPLLVRDFPASKPSRYRFERSNAEVDNRPKVLLFGGIHGDELSSVSVVFKWMSFLRAQEETLTAQFRVVPLLNPDGLLRSRSQRMNQRGVDLNRNFPSPDWFELAHKHWEKKSKNPRLFPGKAPLSEPESRWLAGEIDRYQPDIIIAVHAPIKLVDFDGPDEPPQRLGSLKLRRMGTYPGSLGRYAGVHRGFPVVTIELAHAGIMPSKKEQRRIWSDLIAWIDRRTANQRSMQVSASP